MRMRLCRRRPDRHRIGRLPPAGVGILASNDPTAWVWGRVGGDALDIATLASWLKDENPKKENVGLALAAVSGVTLLDIACASALSSCKNALRASEAATQRYAERSGFRLRHRRCEVWRAISKCLTICAHRSCCAQPLFNDSQRHQGAKERRAPSAMLRDAGGKRQDIVFHLPVVLPVRCRRRLLPLLLALFLSGFAIKFAGRLFAFHFGGSAAS